MTRREELIVGLLRNHDLGMSSKEGVRGDSGSVGLLPHAASCRMRARKLEGTMRCTCWLKSLVELERCLRLMRGTQRPQWYAVHERYVVATRKPLEVLVSHWKPLVAENVEVIGLVNKTDLNKRGDGKSRVLVETWRAGLDKQRIEQGITWLATTFEGAPELPVDLLDIAA